MLKSKVIFYLAPLLGFIGYIYYGELVALCMNVLDVHSLVGFFIVYIVFEGLFIVGLVYYFKQTDRLIYLKRFPITWQNMMLAVGLFIVGESLTDYLSKLVPLSQNQAYNEALSGLVAKEASGTLFALLVIFSVLMVFLEELVFRLLFMTTYFKNSKYGLDVLVATFFFAIMHMKTSQEGWLIFSIYFFPTLTLGLIFKKTKSIYFPFLSHLLHNLLTGLF